MAQYTLLRNVAENGLNTFLELALRAFYRTSKTHPQLIAKFAFQGVLRIKTGNYPNFRF